MLVQAQKYAFLKSLTLSSQNEKINKTASPDPVAIVYAIFHPQYPVNLPSEPITLWQGISIDIRFIPFALATARTASGF